MIYFLDTIKIKNMEYTVDYFIEKFEKIPEARILNGSQSDYIGLGCAYGQCKSGERNQDGSQTNEGIALTKIFESVFPKDYPDYWSYSMPARVNNGEHPDYQQPTPKQRILAALRDIKKMTNEQNPEPSVATGDAQRAGSWPNKQSSLTNLIPIVEEVSDTPIKEIV